MLNAECGMQGAEAPMLNAKCGVLNGGETIGRVHLKAYINKRGGEYAIQDRAKRGLGIMWVICHRPKGGRKWSKVPRAVYHERTASAQLELDVIARRRGLKEC